MRHVLCSTASMTLVHNTMNLELTEIGGPKTPRENTLKKPNVSLINTRKLLLLILMEKDIQLMAL
jgi:hypothetical protein